MTVGSCGLSAIRPMRNGDFKAPTRLARAPNGGANAKLPRDVLGHRPAADRLERLHDVRLVRAPEAPPGVAALDRRARELGDRVLRVLLSGAGKPHRRARGPL